MECSQPQKVAEIVHRVELIKIHTGICLILEKQIAHFGNLTPPYILLDLDNRKKEIERLEAEVVLETAQLSPECIETLGEQLEKKMPERIVISDSSNVLLNTHINAGGDVVILHISKN